ncbi:MAG: hypothetical protein ABSD74_13685 [Rhizomicrobium sp.]|jgi:hypothetical protein
MSDSHVLSGLKAKRVQLAGEIKQVERHLKDKRATLAHLDETLRLFDPELNPRKLSPVRLYKRNGYFKAGEVTRLVQAFLRDCPKPVSSGLIAAEVMRVKGLPSDADSVRAMTAAMVRAVLGRMAKRGAVTKSGAGPSTVWGLEQESE